MSLTVVYFVLSTLLGLSPGSVIMANGKGQITNTKVLESGGDRQCPSMEERERARNEIHQIANSTVVAVATGHIHTCNGIPGWRLVAFINMTDTSYNCPSGLNLTSYSKRTCGASHTGAGCSSTTFSVGGLPYSRVCGKIRAYQFGSTDAFRHYTQGIDSYYVDGISLTHGVAGSRQHIWTFAAGITEVNDSNSDSLIAKCPCDISRNYDRVPAFVGNDYFCESGFNSIWTFGERRILFPDDALWDGQNCRSSSTCCQFNNPPWFAENLPSATTDDIELRLCASAAPSDEDIPIELVELYVQ